MIINKFKVIECPMKYIIGYIIGFFLLFFIFSYTLGYSETGESLNLCNNQKLNRNNFHSIDSLNFSNYFSESYELNIRRLSSYIPERKDPFVAGFLSWLMMGVGQIYCKEYTKGSIFIALDLLDKGTLIALTSYLNKKYSPKGNEIVNINWAAFDSNTKLLIIGYIIAKYSIRFYNVYDAIQAAKNYNKLHFLSKEKTKVFFGLDSDSLQLGYSLEFK